MGKKAASANLSVSILLVVPEGVDHQQAAKDFLAEQQQNSQAIYFNGAGETVKIDLVREIVSHLGFSRGKDEQQGVVLCGAQTATLAAQNALLKLIEEPPSNSQVILVARSGHQLLPTIVSRCREILWTSPANQADEKQQPSAELELLQKFLAQPQQFSYQHVIDLAEKLKDRDVAQKTLRSVIYQAATGQTKLSPAIMKNLSAALDSLEKNGNVRLVLEHFLFAIHRLTLD